MMKSRRLFSTAVVLCFVLHLLSTRAREARENGAVPENYTLPHYVTTCYQDDPNVAACMKDEWIERLRSELIKGMPEFGIKPFEPLHVDEFLAFSVGGLNLKLKDIYVTGISTFQVDSVKVDFVEDGAKFFIHSFIKKLHIEGHYVIDGNIVLMPIFGTGSLTTDLDNITVNQWVFIDKRERNGIKYMNANEMKLEVTFNTGSIFVGNLLIAGDAINQILNANFKYILAILANSVAKAASKLGIDYGNRLFTPVPFYAVYPKGKKPLTGNEYVGLHSAASEAYNEESTTDSGYLVDGTSENSKTHITTIVESSFEESTTTDNSLDEKTTLEVTEEESMVTFPN